ncbi:MAG TPA: TIGR00730 family Rossman fold protein [Microlunatus sp.]
MRICVFCGSSTGRIPAYAEAAAGLGRLLAGRGIGLVYGGATVGTMGILADAALAAGGEVYGVIPQQLVDREIAHRGLTELYEVTDMHERKAKMTELADAFIALPGGAGTLEELFEVWTWSQLGLHSKPIGLLDVAGFYDRMEPLLDHMVAEEFLKPAYREALQIDADPQMLLKRLAAVQAPAPKWSGGAAGVVDPRS